MKLPHQWVPRCADAARPMSEPTAVDVVGERAIRAVRVRLEVVRKQYHFWPGDVGLDAWDVDKLIRLSAGFSVREVPLDALRDVDTDYWFDGSMEIATVRKVVEHMRLVQEVDASHPIILGADGRVMDGMHRVARALLEGRSMITAVQFESQPEPDYRNCRPTDLPYDEEDAE
jgi:hypothetical protein